MRNEIPKMWHWKATHIKGSFQKVRMKIKLSKNNEENIKFLFFQVSLQRTPNEAVDQNALHVCTSFKEHLNIYDSNQCFRRFRVIKLRWRQKRLFGCTVVPMLLILTAPMSSCDLNNSNIVSDQPSNRPWQWRPWAPITSKTRNPFWTNHYVIVDFAGFASFPSKLKLHIPWPVNLPSS